MKAELHDLLARLERAGPERPLRLAIAPPPVSAERDDVSNPVAAGHELPADERAAFIDRLRRSIADDDSPAVLLIDLDGFRAVNYTLGWEAGDHLLDHATRRIADALRQDDS